MNLSVVGISCRQRSFKSLKVRVDFYLNLFLKNMMHLMKNRLTQMQIKSSYVKFECAWSMSGFPCIWLVKQWKVRSFLKLLSIVDFHPVILAILLDFLFICHETDNVTALANTQKHWLTPNQIWRPCCFDRSRDVRLRE